MHRFRCLFNVSHHKPHGTMTQLRILLFLATLLLLQVPLPTTAQESKLSLSVEHSGQDSVGQRLAFALREAIRQSAGYRLVPVSGSLFRIDLVTLDPDRSSGNWTAAAITYSMRNDLPLDKTDPQTWYPIYLSTKVIISGSSRVDEQAKSILAGLDQEVEEYRKALQKK